MCFAQIPVGELILVNVTLEEYIWKRRGNLTFVRSRIQGLRNALPQERTTQKAHADMYNTRSLSLFLKARLGCI